MGTPDFAVGSLKALADIGQNIAGIVTAPDKPAGRGQKIMSPPVKVFAENSNIPNILQPTNLKSPEFIEELKALQADIYIVVAFRMLPEMVWSIPHKGTVNLHASMLPDYRGAAPINWAIINGEIVTGVTTFFIEKEIDTGKIIFTEKVSIGPEMTAGELHDKLMVKGAELLVKTVDSISRNEYPSIAQQDILSKKDLHVAPKISKEDCRIDWNKDGKSIFNLIRGMSPYPTAWTEIKRNEDLVGLKIFEAGFEKQSHSINVGEIITDHKKSLKISINDGFIIIKEIQQSGKKRMNIEEFLKGFQGIENYKLLF